jgi:acetylornithine/succinyldiaminopimelate/putrescine aminotransferase
VKLEQRARKFLGRDSDAEEFQVTRGEGSCVFDANGKRYIDFLAGSCVGNLGWSNAEIERTLRAATKTPMCIRIIFTGRGTLRRRKKKLMFRC